MSRTERTRLVALARKSGMSDDEILKTILAGVPAGDPRRLEIVEWADLLGLSAAEALRIARRANLIPSSHPHDRRTENLAIQLGKILTNELLVGGVFGRKFSYLASSFGNGHAFETRHDSGNQMFF